MPKNEDSDLVTDQEMAFVRLTLTGTMTDRDAAQAAGLNPETAASTQAKPRVHAYMLEHRAAMQQQLLQQEAEKLRRKELRREQVLDRLWEIAQMGPEMTRNSMTSQVKAIQMIVAIEGLIPDRRAGSAANKSVTPLPQADIYQAEWLRERQGKTIDPQSDPGLAQEEDESGLAEPETTPNSGGDAPPPPGTTPSPVNVPSGFANRSNPRPTTSWAPDAFNSAPDTRVPFSIKKNRFGPHR